MGEEKVKVVDEKNPTKKKQFKMPDTWIVVFAMVGVYPKNCVNLHNGVE